MIINILAGGPTEELPDLHQYAGAECIWVGVDRGALTLLQKGIKPTIAVGDFDSVSVEELNQVKTNIHQISIFKPEKDEPDIELACQWAIQQKPEGIRLFGATGGRLDHFLASVSLLTQYSYSSIPIEIINRKNNISIKKPGSYKLAYDQEKKYVSFLPLMGPVQDLTLIGFRYPLLNHHLPANSVLCISNELIEEYGHFSFTQGIVIVVRSSD